jgi:hypothetical protein
VQLDVAHVIMHHAVSLRLLHDSSAATYNSNNHLH